ncbi:MAG: hypothetical protein EOO90_06740 [Pedobacter sp.]|nr:MAG: hypothetical protein EOO90_06740 [Pedobacter sp.]
METFSKKLAGASLLLGSLMAVLTMVLHPSGGNMQHLVKISGVLIFSHSLALACMPLIAFGLWGLSNSLQTPNRLATLSFFIAIFGLSAAALASTINGLVLPQFAAHFVDSKVDEGALDAILDYARFFNKSLAYIFMAAISVAILLWSSLIIVRGIFTKWFGYYGLLVSLFGLVALHSKSNMTSVGLFGAFVFGMASWLILVGVLLIKTHQPER